MASQETIDSFNEYRSKVAKALNYIDQLNNEYKHFMPAVKFHCMVLGSDGEEIEVCDYSTLNRTSALDQTLRSLDCDVQSHQELLRFAGFFDVLAPFSVQCTSNQSLDDFENYEEFLELGATYTVIDHVKYKDAIYFDLEGIEYYSSNGIKGFPSYLFSVQEIVNLN